MRPPNYGFNLVLAAVFALSAAGCVYAAIVTGELPFTLTGVAFALVFAVVAWRVYRAARPPRLRGVELHVSPTEAAPGDVLDVILEPTRARGGSVELGLVGSSILLAYVAGGSPMWTEGRRVFHEQWQELPLDRSHRLRLTLPASAAVTARDRQKRIGWEVVAKRPARLRPDPRIVREVVVARRG